MKFSELDRIKTLIILFLSGNINNNELEELDKWRKLRKNNEEIFRKMTSFKYLEDNIKRLKRSDDCINKEWEEISRRISIQKPNFIVQVIKYAAILILPMTIALTVLYLKNKDIDNTQRDNYLSSITHQGSQAMLILSDGSAIELKNNIGDSIVTQNSNIRVVGDTLKYNMISKKKGISEINRLITRKASDYKVMLSDGTIVYLNSESELSYPVTFDEDSRIVNMRGQAYFKVKEDKQRPFIVTLNGVKIQVYGTSFCVKAYEDENEIAVTLVEGKVGVYSDEFSCLLHPGQQAIIDNDTHLLNVKDVNTQQYTSWKDGRIVFENTSLGEIMKYLSRLYPVDVLFINKEDMDIPFSMNINKYSSFLDIVNLLEKSDCIEFDYQKNDLCTTIIIK